MTVKVAVPVEINDSILTSSDIPEPDPSVGEVAWIDRTKIIPVTSVIGTKYASVSVGDFVYIVGDFGSVIKVDVINETSITFGSHSGTMFAIEYAGGDFIYAAGDSGSILKVDIINETTSSFGSGIQNLSCLHYHTNGFIYGAGDGAPATNGEVIKIDLSLETVSTFGSYDSLRLGIDGYSDQFLYCVGGGLDVLKVDVINETISTLTTQSLNLQQIKKGEDGNMYCVGDTRTVTKINTSSDTFNYFGNLNEGMRDITSIGNKLYSCSVLGNVYEIDYQNNATSLYREITGTLRAISSSGLYMIASGGEDNVTLIDRGYLIDEQVVYLPNHTKYICLANETFSNPSETATGDANAEWLKIGPSNRWSMLDKFIKNKTESTVDFTVEITPGVLFDTVSFFGITGVDTIRVEVFRGTDVVYDETKSFVDLNSIVDWYSYFFYQLTHREEDVFFNIPPYLDTKLRVTFTGTGTGIEVGAMPFGMSQTMGVVCINTKSDTKDYSDIEYDQFGELSEIERPVVSYNTYEIDVKKTLAKSIERKLKDLRGKNALWVGDIGDDQQLITYGRNERSPLTYSNHSIVSYSVKVRGSI